MIIFCLCHKKAITTFYLTIQTIYLAVADFYFTIHTKNKIMTYMNNNEYSIWIISKTECALNNDYLLLWVLNRFIKCDKCVIIMSCVHTTGSLPVCSWIWPANVAIAPNIWISQTVNDFLSNCLSFNDKGHADGISLYVGIYNAG